MLVYYMFINFNLTPIKNKVLRVKIKTRAKILPRVATTERSQPKRSAKYKGCLKSKLYFGTAR